MAKTKRIGLVMSDELVAMIDRFAELNNISRSAAICVLCSQSLTQSEALTTFKRMLEMADKVEPPKVEERTVTEKKPSVSYSLYNL